jgi:Na+/citrate or Na+/malate symporter
MEVNSPQIEATIGELQSRVNEYAGYNPTSSTGGVLPSFSLNLNSIYIYIGIPVVIFILLVFFRPNFVKVEQNLEDGSTQLKTSFKKIMMWSLILGTVFNLGLYGLNYKIKKK